MKFVYRGKVFVLVMAIIVVGLVGCGDDPTTPEDVNEQSLLDFIVGISAFDPPPQEYIAQISSTSEEVSLPDGVLLCTEEEYDMGRNPTEVIAFSPNAASMWPGAIVRGKFVRDGLLTGVGVARQPMKVSVTGLPNMSAEELSRDNLAPSRSTVDGAIDDIVTTFLNKGVTKAPDYGLEVMEAYSFDQVMLDIGISTDWGTGSAVGQFHWERQEEKNTVFVKFVQKYYTAYIDPPTSPAAFFDDAVTPDDLKPYTSHGDPLSYVESVTFGRIGILSITSTVSEDSLKSSVHTSIENLLTDVQVDGAYKQLLEESEIKLLIMGGGDTTNDEVDSLGTDPVAGLRHWITSGMDLTQATKGVPISYTVAHLKDNSKSWFQYTTKFVRKSCALAEQGMWVYIDKIVCNKDESDVGSDNLELEYNFSIKIRTSGLTELSYDIVGGSIELAEGAEHLLGAQRIVYVTRQLGSEFNIYFKIREKDSGFLGGDDNMDANSFIMSYPGWYTEFPASKSFTTVCDADPGWPQNYQKVTVYWRVQGL